MNSRRRHRTTNGCGGIAGGSNLAWAVVGVCMAIGASSAWGQCDEEQKLTAADAAAGDQFGASVSVSGDTVIVGAIADDDTAGDSGSAYVYFRSGGVWNPQQKLTAGADAGAGDLFGWSVSVSGNTAVVGADLDNVDFNNQGSAYVFVRAGGVWTQQQKLTASDAAASDFFGYFVSVAGDTAVVGAYANDDAGTDSRSAYVYVRSGTVWTQQQAACRNMDLLRRREYWRIVDREHTFLFIVKGRLE